MLEEYAWYVNVSSDEDLLQGDFINECPVMVPTSEISDEVEIRIISFDHLVIVL
ncbi:MAG: hypothetical protein HXS48_16625 [Theionarchaea archaeon]|nr:hypothetical protein [Theionarchaea archaeon]